MKRETGRLDIGAQRTKPQIAPRCQLTSAPADRRRRPRDQETDHGCDDLRALQLYAATSGISRTTPTHRISHNYAMGDYGDTWNNDISSLYTSTPALRLRGRPIYGGRLRDTRAGLPRPRQPRCARHRERRHRVVLRRPARSACDVNGSRASASSLARVGRRTESIWPVEQSRIGLFAGSRRPEDRSMDPAVTNRKRGPEPADPAWPRKTRELQNHHMDSTDLERLRLPPRRRDHRDLREGRHHVDPARGRPADLPGPEEVDVATLSPWVDLRVPPKAEKLAAIEAQRHRRFLKTHLPVDALVFSPQAKYIYVGRDGRDIVWSLHNHHSNANEEWYRTMNDTPGRVGPPIQPPPESVALLLPRLAARRRLPDLVVLGERRQLVGGAPPAERPPAALRRPEGGPARVRCAASPRSSTSISTPRRSKQSCGTRALRT